mmetsp:Transcript_20632/g.35222  ORF Transcript_20632/g.35222 Transcript_20632/m.35222 type:complete len:170 (-) Transcript_20632:95-604(-)
MKVLLGLLLLCSVAFAQTIFNFPDPEDFPGAAGADFPQNAGGGTHFPPIGDPDADFFEDQVDLPANNGWTTGLTGGLTGVYPGQNFGRGVDPVRGILPYANLNVGSSGRAATGRSGHGAASGNGFGIAETKLPDRTDVHTTDFITVSLSGAGSVLPTVFTIFAVVALLI